MRMIMMIKEQKGASAVEFAILLPVLILILFGTVEFGLLLYNQQVITNASREGARAGIVAQTPRVTKEQIETVVLNYCGTNLVTFGAYDDPSVNVPPGATKFGDDLTVTVKFKYTFLVLSSLYPNPIWLVSQTLMKLE